MKIDILFPLPIHSLALLLKQLMYSPYLDCRYMSSVIEFENDKEKGCVLVASPHNLKGRTNGLSTINKNLAIIAKVKIPQYKSRARYIDLEVGDLCSKDFYHSTKSNPGSNEKQIQNDFDFLAEKIVEKAVNESQYEY